MTPTEQWLTRPARPDEIDLLAALQVRSRAGAPMPPYGGSTAKLAVDLAAGLVRDHLWVVEDATAGSIAGYVRFVSPDAERVAWLDDLFIYPVHAGLGLGSLLLDVVKAHLSEGFELFVFARNAPARAFYARHGLREVERVAAGESPTGEAEVVLRWR